MIGKTVSHYRILEKLGEGGMGVVYKAEDTKLGRTVALKFLPSELTRDTEARGRFIQEAKAASALDHNNICNIHEIGETEDAQIFIAMACYEGETLKEKMKRGPLEIEEAVRIATQVAQGLAKAHGRGIVHRDIKPANIMVTDDGVVKVVDFGLAKLAGQARLTKTSSTVGTIAYMSPEQVEGREVDTRTDIWSLGVVLYEMVTGKLPFKGEYEPALMYSILNDRPKLMSSLRDSVPRELERVVERTLTKRPEGRFANAADLLADLRVLSENESDRLRAKRLGREGATRVGQERASIAVLPFRSLSESKEDEYFSDGTTEDIITQLSKVGGLRVISRTSVMRYKHSEKSIPEIGRELGVRAILEGSVRRAGGRVRVVAQLLNVQTDEHLWAETYDRDMTDVFAIQSDVAEKIASALEATLSPAEREQIERKPTQSLEAYNYCLKGRFYWNKRQADDQKTAIEHFNRAIGLDPRYALAYVGLAFTYVTLPQYAGLPAKECRPKAEAAAKKALELDPGLGEPHAVLAVIRTYYEWDWAAAEKEYRRAIELAPNSPTAHHWYSIMLSCLGRFDEADAEIRRALELDPLSVAISVTAGDRPYCTRNYDEAIRQYRRTIALDPHSPLPYQMLGRTLVLKGELEEGIAKLEKARAMAGGGPLGLADLGNAYARAGRKSEATKIFEELLGFSREGYAVSCEIAMICHGLGDKDQALGWLERAYEERDDALTDIKIEPVWDGLRSEPRFIALMKKVGLEK